MERDQWEELGVDGWNNIRTELQEVGCGCMEWIGLAQDKRQVKDACQCDNEPSGSVK